MEKQRVDKFSGKFSSSLKLVHIRSHDLGRVFRFIKVSRLLLAPCRLLYTSKRRFFPTSEGGGHALTNDILLFIFLLANVILFLLGCICVLVGLCLFHYKFMVPLVRNQEYITLGTIALLAGIGIILLSSIGIFVIASSHQKTILQMYTMVAVFMIGIEMSLIALLPTTNMQTTGVLVSIYRDSLRTYRPPGDSSYHSLLADALVNIVQSQLHCCGVTGPRDWALQNFIYLDKRGGVLPDSCHCDPLSHATCHNVLMLYNTKHQIYHPVNETVWSSGCRRHFVSLESHIKKIIKPWFYIFQVVLLFISMYLNFSQRRTTFY